MAYEGWAYYSKATPINPSQILTGFPLVIDASRITGIWAYARPDLGDIRVTVDDAPRPCHVIYPNSGIPQALIVINANKSTGNQVVKVYYGNSQAIALGSNDTYGQYNAYNDNIRAFYVSGGGNDATRYLNHLVGVNSPSTGFISPYGIVSTLYNGTTQVATGNVSVPTGLPVSLVAVAYCLNNTNNQDAVALSDTALGNDSYELRWAGAIGGDPIRAVHRRGTLQNADSLAGYITNGWTHGAAVFAGSAEKFAARSGVSGTVNTTAHLLASGIDTISVGAWRANTTTTFFSGHIAHAQIHTTALSTGWLTYDSQMQNQTDFWGSWVQENNAKFLQGYSHYAELTPQYNPNETLTGFPLLISANRIPLLFDFAKPDLSDVRATDTGNNYLPCHIIHADQTSGLGLIAVRLDKGTGNQTIRIHFGNPNAIAEDATGTYGQYNTYNSGIKAFYPSGNGIDVTRNQNHITGNYSGLNHSLPLISGPISGSWATRYTPLSISTGVRPYLTGNFSQTGTLTTFAKPFNIGYTSETQLLQLAQYNLNSGISGYRKLHVTMGYPDTGIDLGLSSSVSRPQIRFGTNNTVPGTIHASDYVVDIEQNVSTGIWTHYGASFTRIQANIVYNDTTGLVENINISNFTGFDSLHIGGASSRAGSGVSESFGSSESESDLSLAFYHNQPQPTGWASYIYKQIDQQNFYAVVLYESGLYTKSRVFTASNSSVGVAKNIGTNSFVYTTSTITGYLTGTAVFPTDWDRHYLITPINPSGSINDLPLIFDLTLISGISGYLKPDGSDIRITDTSNNRLPLDLVYYNGGSGIVIFNPGTKSTSSESYKLWVGCRYANMEAADSTYGQYNVYDSSFNMYYPSGHGLDRTRNQRHLTSTGTGITSTTGSSSSFIGVSYPPRPNTDNVYATTNLGNATGIPITLSAWVNHPASEDAGDILRIGTNHAGLSEYKLFGTSPHTFRVSAGTFGFPSNTIPTNAWGHIGTFISGTNQIGPSDLGIFTSGITGQTRFIAPSLGNLATGSTVFNVNGDPYQAGSSAVSGMRYSFIKYCSGVKNNAWINYDYQMGNQPAFWSVALGTGGIGHTVSSSIYVNTYSTSQGFSNRLGQSTSYVYTYMTSSGNANRRLNSIVDIITNDIYSPKLLRQLSAQYNTTTGSSSSINVLKNIAAAISVVTRSQSGFSGSMSLLVETIANVVTSSSSSARKIAEVRAHVESITASFTNADAIGEIRILTDGNTRTSMIAAVNIQANISSIAAIKTALGASAIIQGATSNPNVVDLTVYLNIETLNSLYISREKGVEVHVSNDG